MKTNKILLICKCGKWKICKKEPHEPKDAIYTYQWCPECVGGESDVNEGYFGDKGEIPILKQEKDSVAIPKESQDRDKKSDIRKRLETSGDPERRKQLPELMKAQAAKEEDRDVENDVPEVPAKDECYSKQDVINAWNSAYGGDGFLSGEDYEASLVQPSASVVSHSCTEGNSIQNCTPLPITMENAFKKLVHLQKETVGATFVMGYSTRLGKYFVSFNNKAKRFESSSVEDSILAAIDWIISVPIEQTFTLFNR
jgi:hypothetical protein